jgi:SAM-dependent methyltransferase
MRSLSYDGTMKFDNLNDSQIRANYQHKHVVDFYIDNFKGKKVLDAGCWTGTMEKEVSRRKFQCQMVGIDLNIEALEVAKNAFPKYDFFQINLAKPDPKFMRKYSGYFDSTIFLDVIEHVPVGTEGIVLKNIYKLLKKDGVLIVSTMNSHPLNFIDPAWFLGHRHYKASDIDELLQIAGFKSTDVLKIGNLFWDIDILLLYTYKHIFHTIYKTSQYMYRQIMKGLTPQGTFATRIYAIAKKS